MNYEITLKRMGRVLFTTSFPDDYDLAKEVFFLLSHKFYATKYSVEVQQLNNRVIDMTEEFEFAIKDKIY